MNGPTLRLTIKSAVDAAHRKGRDQWHLVEMTPTSALPSNPG